MFFIFPRKTPLISSFSELDRCFEQLHCLHITFLRFSFHYNPDGFSFPKGMQDVIHLLIQSDTYRQSSAVCRFGDWRHIQQPPEFTVQKTSDPQRNSTFTETVYQEWSPSINTPASPFHSQQHQPLARVYATVLCTVLLQLPSLFNSTLEGFLKHLDLQFDQFWYYSILILLYYRWCIWVHQSQMCVV